MVATWIEAASSVAAGGPASGSKARTPSIRRSMSAKSRSPKPAISEAAR